jgi:hypothetical protein
MCEQCDPGGKVFGLVRTVRCFLIAVVMVAVVSLGASPSGATAGPRFPFTDLQLKGFGSLVVDNTHDYVFVSGGPGDNVVRVLNFYGELVKSIPVPGADGMALHESSLYVASRKTSRIYEIHTGTLVRQSHVHSVGHHPLTGSIAWGHDRLWFGFGQCGQFHAGLGSLDPASDTVATYRDSQLGYCTQVATDPFAPNVVFAWDAGMYPPTLHEFTVAADDTASETVQRTMDEIDSMSDLAISPSGDRVLIPDAGTHVLAFRPSDLHPLPGSYPVQQPSTDVIATTAFGGEVVAGSSSTYNKPDVFTFREGTVKPTFTYDFSAFASDPETLYAGSLALDDSASHVFAVTGERQDRALFYSLPPSPHAPTIGLSASTTPIAYHGNAVVEAHFHGSAGASGALALYRTPYGRGKTLIRKEHVTGSGDLLLKLRDLAANFHVIGEFAPDDGGPPVELTHLIGVMVKISTSMPNADGRNGQYFVFHHHSTCSASHTASCPILVLHVAPDHTGKPIAETTQYFSGGRWHAAASDTFDIRSGSSVSIAFLETQPGESFRSQASFSDEDHARTVSTWVYWKVVSTGLLGRATAHDSPQPVLAR